MHPFFSSVVPAVNFHVPLMSAKLLHASAWDDINNNCEISELTLFQRRIAEGIMSDCLAESKLADSDANLLALLALLAFEVLLLTCGEPNLWDLVLIFTDYQRRSSCVL